MNNTVTHQSICTTIYKHSSARKSCWYERIFSFGCLLLITFSTVVTWTPSVHAQDMTPQLSPLCVSIRGGFSNNGTRMTLWECHGGVDQNWRLQDGLIRNNSVNKCLSVHNGDVRAGKEVLIWDCHGGADQQWMLTSEGTIQSSHNPNLCLSTYNGSLNADSGLVVWSCHGKHDQRWRLTGRPLTYAPDFVISRIGRTTHGHTLVTVRNLGLGGGVVTRVACSRPGLPHHNDFSSSISAGAEGQFTVHLTSLVGSIVTCSVIGTSDEGLPETVTFNNTLVTRAP